MKKLLTLLMAVAVLAMSFTFTASAAETKVGINDASKWHPCFLTEEEDRLWKTPDQSVTVNNDGSVTFAGIGGDRENFTYGFSEPINFPAEDLVIEFTINEGMEPEMLFAFAFTDIPNWASWYSNNDHVGFGFNVRPVDRAEFHTFNALEWPTTNEGVLFPQDDGHPAHADKDEKMTYVFTHTDKGMALYVNGVEIEGFEDSYSEFYMDVVLPEGKSYLSVSGLNYTFDPELESKLTIHTVKTMPKGTALGGSEQPTTSDAPDASEPSDETPSTDGPAIDDGTSEEEIGGAESSAPSTDASDVTSEDASSVINAGNGGEGPNVGLIILIVVLAVVVVAAVVVVVIILMKKKKAE
ncbi:MAG: hypothetical protein IJY82_06430 [Oscillospiraceae bacterium]|nr:hypothetical protein [Oscillospiraceae bacterium]